MKKLMIALLTSLLLITGTAYAYHFDNGVNAYNKGNFFEAIKLFKQAALQSSTI